MLENAIVYSCDNKVPGFFPADPISLHTTQTPGGRWPAAQPALFRYNTFLCKPWRDSPTTFLSINLIFWIVIGCGFAPFRQRVYKPTHFYRDLEWRGPCSAIQGPSLPPFKVSFASSFKIPGDKIRDQILKVQEFSTKTSNTTPYYFP